MGILGLRECEARSGPVFEKLTDKCSLRVFPAPAFVADFPPVAPNFITVRTTYASKIWAQLTKNLLTRSGTERFRENI